MRNSGYFEMRMSGYFMAPIGGYFEMIIAGYFYENKQLIRRKFLPSTIDGLPTVIVWSI